MDFRTFEFGLNINLDPETHRLFKLAAVAAGTDMTEAIKVFIDAYVQKHLPREMRSTGRKKKA